MAEEATADGVRGDRPVRPAELEQAGVWLTGHGLTGATPSPLLARRLAVRRRARPAAHLLLAVFIIVVALIYVANRPAETGGDGAFGGLPFLLLTAAVAGLVLAQALLDRWVRRVDRRAAATLPRRAAHSVRLGWRTVLGVPRAAFAAVMFAGALTLTTGALITRDSTTRYAALVLIVALCGVAANTAVQLHHVLTHPSVADDEGSLTADIVMRIEDAREVATPTVVWCLPVASVYDAGLDWWNTAWLVFVVLGISALTLITVRTAKSGAVARHATSVR